MTVTKDVKTKTKKHYSKYLIGAFDDNGYYKRERNKQLELIKEEEDFFSDLNIGDMVKVGGIELECVISDIHGDYIKVDGLTTWFYWREVTKEPK